MKIRFTEDHFVYTMLVVLTIFVIIFSSVFMHKHFNRPLCITSEFNSFAYAVSNEFEQPEYMYVVRIVDFDYNAHDYEFGPDEYEKALSIYTYFLERSEYGK